MTSEIDKLKHFHVENYSDTNFTDDLNDGEEFLYTTIRCKDDKEVTLLCKLVQKLCDWNIISPLRFTDEEWMQISSNTDKMTASDYTHLFGYLNPYYRSAYNVSKRRK